MSLLSTFFFFFWLMKEFLVNYVDAKKIPPRHFGFQSGLNSFDSLSTYSEATYSTPESSQSLLSICIDFTKAFDIVQHDILL